jgi:hypothetical protein
MERAAFLLITNIFLLSSNIKSSLPAQVQLVCLFARLLDCWIASFWLAGALYSPDWKLTKKRALRTAGHFTGADPDKTRLFEGAKGRKKARRASSRVHRGASGRGALRGR